MSSANPNPLLRFWRDRAPERSDHADSDEDPNILHCCLGLVPRTGGHDRMVVRNQRFMKLKREARMLLWI